MTRVDEYGRCLMSDLEPSQCAHCRGSVSLEDAPRSEVSSTGPLFEAQYPGKCAGCGDPIEPGDSIAKAGASYVCGECVVLA